MGMEESLIRTILTDPENDALRAKVVSFIKSGFNPSFIIERFFSHIDWSGKGCLTKEGIRFEAKEFMAIYKLLNPEDAKHWKTPFIEDKQARR